MASVSVTEQPSWIERRNALAYIVAKKCRRSSTLEHVSSLYESFRETVSDGILQAAARNQHGVEMLHYMSAGV